MATRKWSAGSDFKTLLNGLLNLRAKEASYLYTVILRILKTLSYEENIYIFKILINNIKLM